MKMMRQEESERIGKIIQEITGIMKDNRCDRCISEDRGTMRQRSKEGETVEETYQNILNLREEYAGKVDRLLKEATGKVAQSEVFNETRLTNIVHEDSEFLVLQLKQDRDGPVWRHTHYAVAELEEAEPAAHAQEDEQGRKVD